MPLGSVAYGVAGQASCDVAVVREVPAAVRPEIVAGIDRSPAGAKVLDRSRGHGEFTGLLLGSVCQAMLHYATCPVIVVRAPPAG
ncbi:MAG: universal stress protein [Microbispora sp.]|nr:universal stress protein [Microbispora sp.]